VSSSMISSSCQQLQYGCDVNPFTKCLDCLAAATYLQQPWAAAPTAATASRSSTIDSQQLVPAASPIVSSSSCGPILIDQCFSL
jgi:hypothetical protein